MSNPLITDELQVNQLRDELRRLRQLVDLADRVITDRLPELPRIADRVAFWEACLELQRDGAIRRRLLTERQALEFAERDAYYSALGRSEGAT